MTEIDVSDKVEFINAEDDIYLKCVCGEIFNYFSNYYNIETRLLWHCPKCNAKIYFKDEGENKKSLVQVIDD